MKKTRKEIFIYHNKKYAFKVYYNSKKQTFGIVKTKIKTEKLDRYNDEQLFSISNQDETVRILEGVLKYIKDIEQFG